MKIVNESSWGLFDSWPCDAIGANYLTFGQLKNSSSVCFGSELTIELAKLFRKTMTVKKFNDLHVIDGEYKLSLVRGRFLFQNDSLYS